MMPGGWRHSMLGLLLLALAGCQSVSDDLAQRTKACQAGGGVMTGMGCQGGTSPGATQAAPPPPMNCQTKTSTKTLADGTEQTDSTQICTSF